MHKCYYSHYLVTMELLFNNNRITPVIPFMHGELCLSSSSHIRIIPYIIPVRCYYSRDPHCKKECDGRLGDCGSTCLGTLCISMHYLTSYVLTPCIQVTCVCSRMYSLNCTPLCRQRYEFLWLVHAPKEKNYLKASIFPIKP